MSDAVLSDTPTYLNDVWTLYFHVSDDMDWTLASYIRLTDISTVEDYWWSQQCIREHMAENMFFIMREGVYPCWDDPKNMYGGCISMKFPKAEAVRAWEHVCVHVLGETMATDRQAWESVNGVSLSPKKYFCILKIWLNDSSTHVDLGREYATPPWYKGDVLYRNHMDCIKANSEKLTRLAARHAKGESSSTLTGV